jgi:Tfp pilus assembly protein PilO
MIKPKEKITVKNIYKKFKSLFKNEKTGSYFTITFSLLTLSFFGLFAIRPTLMTAISLIKSVSELRELNLKYENKINSLIKAQSEYEKVRDDLYLIDLAIPKNPLFSKFVMNIEKIAQKSGVTVIQMQLEDSSISDLPPADKPIKMNFSLITSGDYASTISYIQNLINWNRIVTFNSLDFSKESSASGSGNIKLTLRGNTYYEP